MTGRQLNTEKENPFGKRFSCGGPLPKGFSGGSMKNNKYLSIGTAAMGRECGPPDPEARLFGFLWCFVPFDGLTIL